MEADYDRDILISGLKKERSLLDQKEQLIDEILKELEEKSDIEEYRTPKKVLYHESKRFICPTCKKFLRSTAPNHKGYSYCLYCGQALNWSEVTE